MSITFCQENQIRQLRTHLELTHSTHPISTVAVRGGDAPTAAALQQRQYDSVPPFLCVCVCVCKHYPHMHSLTPTHHSPTHPPTHPQGFSDSLLADAGRPRHLVTQFKPAGCTQQLDVSVKRDLLQCQKRPTTPMALSLSLPPPPPHFSFPLPFYCRSYVAQGMKAAWTLD